MGSPNAPGDADEAPSVDQESRPNGEAAGVQAAGTVPERTEEEEGYLVQLQRLQAEFSNYRKRILRERADWDIRAKGEILADLVPVLDDIARAREAHVANPPSAEAEGLLLILARLEEALTAFGLEKQATAAGTPFDPHIHEALAASPSEEYPEGTIIETLQPGYLFRGQILRPARVRVSAGPSVAVS